MFTVTGEFSGTTYRVGVHDEPPEGSASCLMGNATIEALLELHEGDTVRATPTSSSVSLDRSAPRSILAFLMERTSIIQIDGTPPPPPVGEDDDLESMAGVIY